MNFFNALERLALYSANRSIARRENERCRQRERREQQVAIAQEAEHYRNSFLRWAQAHQQHPLTGRVLALVEEVNSDLRLDELKRNKKLDDIYCNGCRLAEEADRAARSQTKLNEHAMQRLEESKKLFEIVTQISGVASDMSTGQWLEQGERVELMVDLDAQVISRLREYEKLCPAPVVSESRERFEAMHHAHIAMLAAIHRSGSGERGINGKGSEGIHSSEPAGSGEAKSTSDRICEESARDEPSTDRPATSNHDPIRSAAPSWDRLRGLNAGISNLGWPDGYH